MVRDDQKERRGRKTTFDSPHPDPACTMVHGRCGVRIKPRTRPYLCPSGNLYRSGNPRPPRCPPPAQDLSRYARDHIQSLAVRRQRRPVAPATGLLFSYMLPRRKDFILRTMHLGKFPCTSPNKHRLPLVFIYTCALIPVAKHNSPEAR